MKALWQGYFFTLNPLHKMEHINYTIKVESKTTKEVIGKSSIKLPLEKASTLAKNWNQQNPENKYYIVPEA